MGLSPCCMNLVTLQSSQLRKTIDHLGMKSETYDYKLLSIFRSTLHSDETSMLRRRAEEIWFTEMGEVWITWL